jgi:transcriptional regulator with XRE-family HTH domain
MGEAMTTKQQIGSRIKELRKSRGLSQEKLSEKVGMSSKYLSSIERGYENPTLDTFIRLAAALDVDIFELFNYPENRPRKLSKKFLLDLIKSSINTPHS